MYCIRPVGAGGAMVAPQILANLNLFSIRGKIMHTTLLLSLPGFSDLPTALLNVLVNMYMLLKLLRGAHYALNDVPH